MSDEEYEELEVVYGLLADSVQTIVNQNNFDGSLVLFCMLNLVVQGCKDLGISKDSFNRNLNRSLNAIYEGK